VYQADQLETEALTLHDRPQLAIHLVQGELRHLEQHDAPRPQACNLAAQFGADRAAGARHHDDFVADAGVEQPLVRRHAVAAEEVGRVHVAHVLDPGRARDDVGDVGHGHDAYRVRLERLQDLLPAPARLRGQREQDDLDGLLLDQHLQRPGRVHVDARHHAAVQGRVVVEEGDRIVGGPAAQGSDGLRARSTRTVDDNALGPHRTEIHQVASEDARAADVHKGEGPVDEQGLERNAIARQHGIDDCEGHDRGRDAGRHRDDGLCADEADHRPVEAQSHEDRDARDERRNIQPRGSAEPVGQALELQGECAPERGGHEQDVGGEHDRPLACARQANEAFS
jgi:hypothetical protein